MSAIAQDQPNHSPVGELGFIFFVIAVIVIAMLLGLPGILPCHDSPGDAGTVDSLNHADLKHGLDAEVAREWIAQNGRFCKWRCPDGRDRYVCRMEDGKWAIRVVLEQTGDEVTAFITARQSYVLSMIEGCRNDWHYEHP